jgi:glycosyltransferase involved in cell wall biosynthesis
MKKKLLYLTSRLPWPPIGGEKNKTMQQLRILSQNFNITLISFAENVENEKALTELKQFASEIHLIHEFKLLKLLRCLNALFDPNPIQIHLFYSSKFQKKVNELLPSHDLLFCNLIRTAEYGLHSKIPKFLDLADSIGLHYINAADKLSSLLWKLIYKIEGPRLFAYEKKCAGIFDKSFLFNKLEVEKFNIPQKLLCLPHGVNESLFNHKSSEPIDLNRICFLGKMDYRPNIEAVIWFAKNVMPLIPSNFEFWIIGAFPSNEVLNLAKTNTQIKVTGFVDDPFALIKASLCSVTPVFTGGGIQNKLIEAMALGTICITTSFCTKALENIVVGKHLLVADDAESMSALIKSILADIDKYSEIKTNAKLYIKQNLTWNAYSKLLLESLGSG